MLPREELVERCRIMRLCIESSRMTDQEMFDFLGWCKVEPTDETRRISKGFTAMSTDFRLDLFRGGWDHSALSKKQRVDMRKNPLPGQLAMEEIAGKMVQTDLSKILLPSLTKLRESMNTIVRAKFLQLHRLDGAFEPTFEMSVPKLLVSSQGNGAQMLHKDSVHGDPQLHVATTTLMYCTSSTSALLPLFYSPTQLSDVKLSGGVHPELQARCFLFDDHPEKGDSPFYLRLRVEAGTMFYFRHFVPHAGSASDKEGLRVLAFNMAGRADDMPDPTQQYSWWHYVRDVYGERTLEYMRALMAGAGRKKHSSLQRETEDDHHKFKRYLARLQRWDANARAEGLERAEQLARFDPAKHLFQPINGEESEGEEVTTEAGKRKKTTTAASTKKRKT
jgi:hypothetical protein